MTRKRSRTPKADVSKAIVAAVGDFHSATSRGLVPPVVRLDGGGEYHHSDEQRWLWAAFQDYCQRVADAKKKYGYPVVAILNGETADINKHSAVDQLSVVESTAVAIATEALSPLVSIADMVYVLRGTEAHTGKNSTLDELVAERLNAVPDKTNDTRSWWHLFVEIGGLTFDVSHHPGHGHSRPWTRGGGANRLAFQTMSQYNEAGERPPDIIIRGHNHRYEDSGRNFGSLAIINYSWKLTDSYGYRIGAGRHYLPVGGLLFVCEDGEYNYQPIKYVMPARAESAYKGEWLGKSVEEAA